MLAHSAKAHYKNRAKGIKERETENQEGRNTDQEVKVWLTNMTANKKEKVGNTHSRRERSTR